MCLAQGLTAFALLYYNALTALPLSLLMGFVAGEPSTLANFEFLFHPVRVGVGACGCAYGAHARCCWCTSRQGFLLGVFVSSMLGMVLSYALVLCSTINSPLATRCVPMPSGSVSVRRDSHVCWVQCDGQLEGHFVDSARRGDVW